MPGKHRVVFDTSTPDGVGDALRFGNNYLRVNRSDYGLENSDLAVLIIVRHRSAPFGYKDAMWVKYGPVLARWAAPFEDPKTKTIPKLNISNSADYGSLLSSAGATMESLAKSGVHFGVCSSSTHGIAGAIARESGGKADAVYDEIAANLVSNARLVPAGIVAVNRAQERGYTLARTERLSVQENVYETSTSESCSDGNWNFSGRGAGTGHEINGRRDH